MDFFLLINFLFLFLFLFLFEFNSSNAMELRWRGAHDILSPVANVALFVGWQYSFLRGGNVKA